MIMSLYEGWESVRASDVSRRGGGAPISFLDGHCKGMKTMPQCYRREDGTAGVSRLRQFVFLFSEWKGAFEQPVIRAHQTQAEFNKHHACHYLQAPEAICLSSSSFTTPLSSPVTR